MLKNKRVEIINYKAKQTQSLKNVAFYSPSIIWVLKGSKEFSWLGQKASLTSNNWLLVPTYSSLTFSNKTYQDFFQSKQLILPNNINKNLYLSKKTYKSQDPTIAVNDTMKFLWQSIEEAITMKMSAEIVNTFVSSLLIYLSQNNSLHLLYPNIDNQLKSVVYNYISNFAHRSVKQKEVADFLAMSESSLKRKLALWQTSFRKIYLEAKMNYALSLMQKQKMNTLNLAVSCGYSSANRFSKRFKMHFGMNLSDYLRSVITN